LRLPHLEESSLKPTSDALLSNTLAFLFATVLFAVPVAAQTAGKPLTVEAIFANPAVVGHEIPDSRAWSPDGKHLTYMDDGQVLEVEQTTGKTHVLVSGDRLAKMAGASDTETDKDHRDRYKMAGFLWAPDSAHLLFDQNGRLWLYDLASGKGREVGNAGVASGDDPKFSPDGSQLSFVRDHGLAIVRLKDAALPASQVAPAPSGDILNGEVDWVYLEELDVRSNYFWSPDSTRLAYLQTNEAKVPEYPLTDWIPTHATVEMQRYPQAGDPNPAVRVGVVNASGGETVWIQLPIRAGEDYIPRFGWLNAKTLWVETITRDHRHRDIYFADAATGKAHPALQLFDDKFFDEKQYELYVGDGSLVLTGWSDGHNHVYLYKYDLSNPETAKLERQLTKGEFEVDSVIKVDPAHKLVYFASNEGNLLERQIWQVSFAGDRKQLSTSSGAHSVEEDDISPIDASYIEKRSTRQTQPELDYCRSSGSCMPIWVNHGYDAFQIMVPQQLEVKAQDGTTLYATLLLPAGASTPASVPLIVNPYGGPGVMDVGNEWNRSILFDQLLAQHGFAVLHTDNRGMGMRGRAFAQTAYHNFGPVQFQDQITALDAVLAQYPQLDRKRLGWWGWSWGGTFTLYAMSHSDRFRAGVSVAPVTDWKNYDSIYTERYMSQPAEFSEGYRDFSVVNSADKLKGHLLLVHGTGDDNVHMENSMQYIQQLIEAGIPYDLQLYPRKTHSISGPDVRVHLFNRILAHFEQYLMPALGTEK
jgi:dipeptidyl-peptidase-4